MSRVSRVSPKFSGFLMCLGFRMFALFPGFQMFLGWLVQ